MFSKDVVLAFMLNEPDFDFTRQSATAPRSRYIDELLLREVFVK
jgi:hypothetical protein